MTRNQKAEVLKTVDFLLRMAKGDPGVVHQLLIVRRLLKTPLREVLAKVPGQTVSEKARKVGVSRQTYYMWQRGQARPNATQAARLEEITGVKA